jgi:hypothetical protein
MKIDGRRYWLFYRQKTDSIYGYATLRYGKEAGCKRFIEVVLWMALVPLGVISQKSMANGLQFTKNFIVGVVLGFGNV